MSVIENIDLRETTTKFLKSKEGQVLLAGLGAATYVDYCEIRVLPENQSKKYEKIMWFMEEFYDNEGYEGDFIGDLRGLTAHFEDNFENAGERSLFYFLDEENLWAEQIAIAITSVEKINYKVFGAIEKDFMKRIINEIIFIVNEALDSGFRKKFLEQALNPEKLN